MSKEYKDDNESLHNDSKYEVDGGTAIVGYLIIALMFIIASLVFWFGTEWLIG